MPVISETGRDVLGRHYALTPGCKGCYFSGVLHLGCILNHDVRVVKVKEKTQLLSEVLDEYHKRRPFKDKK